MTDEEQRELKAFCDKEIDFAIAEHGGLDKVHEAHSMMPGMVDYIAGWVSRSYWIHRQVALLRRRQPTQEEIRRIYDLVRLKLDTGSATS